MSPSASQPALWEVARQHYKGLHRPGERRLRVSVWMTLVVIPLLVAAAIAVLNAKLVAPTALLTAATVLVGAMLTLFVFLTNLRVKLDETPKYVHRRQLQRSVAGATVSALYVAALSIATALALAISAGFSSTAFDRPVLERVGAAVSGALVTHLAFSLLTVVTRAVGVYATVFAKDFGPDLDVADEPDDDVGQRVRRSR